MAPFPTGITTHCENLDNYINFWLLGQVGPTQRLVFHLAKIRMLGGLKQRVSLAPRPTPGAYYLRSRSNRWLFVPFVLGLVPLRRTNTSKRSHFDVNRQFVFPHFISAKWVVLLNPLTASQILTGHHPPPCYLQPWVGVGHVLAAHLTVSLALPTDNDSKNNPGEVLALRLVHFLSYHTT